MVMCTYYKKANKNRTNSNTNKEDANMTNQQAYEILTQKYPQANFKKEDVSVVECSDADGSPVEQIEAWSDPGCEFNSHAYCTDWFDLDGNHIGHKCK